MEAPTGAAARRGGAHRFDAGTCAPRQNRPYLTINWALSGGLGPNCRQKTAIGRPNSAIRPRLRCRYGTPCAVGPPGVTARAVPGSPGVRVSPPMPALAAMPGASRLRHPAKLKVRFLRTKLEQELIVDESVNEVLGARRAALRAGRTRLRIGVVWLGHRTLLRGFSRAYGASPSGASPASHDSIKLPRPASGKLARDRHEYRQFSARGVERHGCGTLR